MSIFKNSTNPGSVGGSSMWTPQAKGDTSKFWGSFSGDKGGKSGKMPKNPGMDEQRNSKKSMGCPFCGG